MVTVTDQAALVLRATLAQARTQPGQTLRLVLSSDGGFGLGVDQKRDGDQVVIAHGENILLIAPDAAEALDGAKIDIQSTNGRRKIVISP
jgi:Fe-S cluster assembly iron-binding protein IscA